MARAPRKPTTAATAGIRRSKADRIQAELARPIATTANGRDITQPWITLLQEARDPLLSQAVDWGRYDEVLADPEVMSTFQQRRRAVTSAEWDVIPGDDEEPRSVEAADKLKDNLSRIGLDRVTDKMLYGIMYGHAVAELMWGYRDGLIQFNKIHVRHARRFRVDRDDKLRLLTSTAPQGELLPDRKFWMLSTGGTDDDEPYGRGLAKWLYWPTLFKRNGIGFWNIFLDKFGSPTVKGTYRRGTPQADIDKLLAALGAIATDGGFVIPEGMVVELLQLAGSGTADFEKLVRYMDETIAKVVLSQTMTTSDGSSHSQAEVHAGVKLEVVTGDADLVCESFNDGPARWWTDMNYGEDVASPKLVRLLDEEEDTKTTAETDAILANSGWVRTEESFRDVYGDGYERKAEPVVEPGIGHNGGPALSDDQPGADPESAADPDDGTVVPFKRGAASFAELTRERDAIDGAIDALIERDGWEALAPIVAPIADAVAKSGSAEELDANLIAALDQSDVTRLTEAFARAGFAVRVAEETGTDTTTKGE